MKAFYSSMECFFSRRKGIKRMSDEIFEKFKTHVIDQKGKESSTDIYEAFIGSSTVGIHSLDNACLLMALIPKIRKGQRRLARAGGLA